MLFRMEMIEELVDSFVGSVAFAAKVVAWIEEFEFKIDDLFRASFAFAVVDAFFRFRSTAPRRPAFGICVCRDK